MAQRVKCSRCIKTAILMCFCKELPFCQGCIGAHLTEASDYAHNTVKLEATEMLEIMRGGASQLNQAREKVILEQQEVLKRKTAVLERITREVAAINVFEEHTLDLLETITTALVSSLIQTRKAMRAQVKEGCLKMRLQLEDVKVSLNKSSGMESLEVLKSFPALEEVERPLVTMNSEYQEINIEKHFRDAFRLNIDWAFDTGETVRFFDTDTLEVLTVDASTYATKSKGKVRDFVPAYQASICVLPKNEFLITGGGVKSQGTLVGALETATVLKESLSISQLAPMLSQRMGHGSIHSNGYAYAVGGWPVSNLCEKFSFAEGRWEQIANMKQGRSYPGLCEFEGKLYVAGGHEVDSIEMYIPSHDTFMAMGIRLSAPGRCGLVALSDCILAVHGDNISKIMPLKSVCIRERGVAWRADTWLRQPMVQTKEAVLIFLQGRVWRYNPSDNDLLVATDTAA